MLKAFYQVEQLLKNETVPSYTELFSLCDKVVDVLENENITYRPNNRENVPGSLLELKNNLPVIIIPDIHARPDFLLNILNYKLKPDFTGKKRSVTVAYALEKKLINIVCVGDAIHSELSRVHWELIQEEFNENNFTGPVMQKEMKNCLAVLSALMCLKIKHTEHFHFLKGNHENILNENKGGDFSFIKYAEEGEMVKKFVRTWYGDDILYLISCYENNLPLVACGKNYVISHAEPYDAYSKDELINARLDEFIVKGLIWTRNGDVVDNTAQAIINSLIDEKYHDESWYFAGHRPVKENYSLRQNGRFIQIHNPFKQNIALVYNNKDFNPETDIVGVDHE